MLALWKIDHCLGEEDYVPWDPETVGWMLDGPFRQQLSSWLKAAEAGRSDAGKWLEWLRNGAERVIEAQFGEATPRNLPTYLPGEAAVTASRLLDLHYLSLDVPHWILADDWNDVEGLFRFRGRWFFAEWGTNA